MRAREPLTHASVCPRSFNALKIPPPQRFSCLCDEVTILALPAALNVWSIDRVTPAPIGADQLRFSLDSERASERVVRTGQRTEMLVGFLGSC